MLKARFVH